MGKSSLAEGLIGSPEPGRITIKEYDHEWAKRFQEEALRIRRALGKSAGIIEHIGSTAVSGLAAKPIVDVLVAVGNVAQEERYRRQLENAGYSLRVREAGHRMFRTQTKDVHVHIWSSPDEIARHLLFRDWLRANEDDRQLYERTKRDLATRIWPDVNEYAQAKTAVISEIMDRARLGSDRASRGA